jgi:gliding motility-associated-like protein
MLEMIRTQIVILFFIFLQPIFLIGQVANFSADQTSICLGDSIQFTDLTTDSPTTWAWEFGDGQTSNQQNPKVLYSTPGIYNVTLSVDGTASIEAKINYITVFNSPTANFDTLLTSANLHSWFFIGFLADSIYTNPFDSLFHSWDFGDNQVFIDTFFNYSASGDWYSPSPFHLYDQAGNYNIFYKVAFDNGCADSANISITVADKDSLFLPNVFTPDGDGLNDNFIIGSNGTDKFSVVIYSRWGNTIYKSDLVQQVVWDGRTPDGTLVEPGVYYYVVTQETGSIDYPPKQGFVHIFYKP